MKVSNVAASVMKSILPFLLLFDGSSRVNDSSRAIACGYHVATPAFLTAPHPSTYAIAVALRKAADEKRVTLINPKKNATGFHGAVGKLMAFNQRLERVMQDLSSENPSLGLSIVLVDVSLWSRIVIKDGKFKLQPHVKGAAPGDVVVSTAESVLAAMLHGKISFQEAVTRGLIHFEGPDIKVSHVKQMIASSIRSTNRISSVPTSSGDQALKQNASIAKLPGKR
ncbi:hypothetical protein [uncultured Gimesia sp.]|uniref:hypothetical protein n=1 Tax=uncultured Gimesia sp. TaxID=1678688 RepID=UPI0026277297|nr:hypothetical protein [uncultured Gimesia sp.]